MREMYLGSMKKSEFVSLSPVLLSPCANLLNSLTKCCCPGVLQEWVIGKLLVLGDDLTSVRVNNGLI